MICHSTVMSNAAQSHALFKYHLQFRRCLYLELSLCYSLCVRHLMVSWIMGLILRRGIVTVLD
jgi:hypothetical protein